VHAIQRQPEAMNLNEIQRWATVAESKPEPVGLDELIRRLLDDWGLMD